MNRKMFQHVNQTLTMDDRTSIENWKNSIRHLPGARTERQHAATKISLLNGTLKSELKETKSDELI